MARNNFSPVGSLNFEAKAKAENKHKENKRMGPTIANCPIAAASIRFHSSTSTKTERERRCQAIVVLMFGFHPHSWTITAI
jgi:hypothetical protein